MKSISSQMNNLTPPTLPSERGTWVLLLPEGGTLAIKLWISSVTAMISDLLLFMKSAKATDLFLIYLILIRLVLGPGFILTSPVTFCWRLVEDVQHLELVAEASEKDSYIVGNCH